MDEKHLGATSFFCLGGGVTPCIFQITCAPMGAHNRGKIPMLDRYRIFLDTIEYQYWGLHSFRWVWVWVFDMLIFCFRTIQVYIVYTMQELSYLGRITLVLNMVLTQTINRVYKDSLTFTYIPNINIWLVLQFWYPHVGSLIPLLMLIINTMHSPIYLSNIGKFLTCSPTRDVQWTNR